MEMVKLVGLKMESESLSSLKKVLVSELPLTLPSRLEFLTTWRQKMVWLSGLKLALELECLNGLELE